MKVDNRSRLLQAAETITYRQGFGSSAIADIAQQAEVPLGNVYYYYKTKDQIGDAIVELRLLRFRKLLQELDKSDSPKERLCGFVQIKIKNREARLMAEELSKLTGESMTTAVTVALRERLARVRQQQGLSLADRLLAIGRDCAARLKEPFRSADHRDLLYDERGLPR